MLLTPIVRKLSGLIRYQTDNHKERRELLSVKLFNVIVNNEQNKLANLLPPLATSHTHAASEKREKF